MTRGFPYPWRGDNAGVQAYYIVARVNHVTPPALFDVIFEFDYRGQGRGGRQGCNVNGMVGEVMVAAEES